MENCDVTTRRWEIEPGHYSASISAIQSARARTIPDSVVRSLLDPPIYVRWLDQRNHLRIKYQLEANMTAMSGEKLATWKFLEVPSIFVEVLLGSDFLRSQRWYVYADLMKVMTSAEKAALSNSAGHCSVIEPVAAFTRTGGMDEEPVAGRGLTWVESEFLERQLSHPEPGITPIYLVDSWRSGTTLKAACHGKIYGNHWKLLLTDYRFVLSPNSRLLELEPKNRMKGEFHVPRGIGGNLSV